MDLTMSLTYITNKTERFERILIDLGYELSDRGKYWQSSALYRQGDNRTAIQIWKNTGVWRDYVASTSYQPFKRLVELSCRDEAKITEIISAIEKQDDSYLDIHKTPKMESEQFFDHDEVKTLLPHYNFYNQKKISDDTLRLYRSGFSMSGKMNGRFVFPIFDENGKVVGLSGRHLLWNNHSSTPKWKHIGKKANWIYPIKLQNEKDNIFLKTIEEKKQIILIEGIGDSLALSQNGYYNHLVVFGLEISSKQISYLLSLNVDKIIIATNNDKEKTDNRGLAAAIKMYVKLIKYFDISKVEIRLPMEKDFGEMLQSGIDMSKWENKKVNKKSQVEYIINHLYNNDNENSQLQTLKNYLEELNFERDTISE